MPELSPAISVIIAAYNAADTIERVIASIKAQSFQDFEIIVIDDCSTDMTVAVVQSMAVMDRRIRVISSSVNGGPATARNLGLDAARGEFVAIVDADDFILPERFSKMMDAARSRDVQIVFDNIFWTDPKTGADRKIYLPAYLNIFGNLSLESFLQSHRIIDPVPNLGFLKPLIRREAIEIHKLRYDRSLLIGEDAYLIMQLMAQGAKAWLLKDACYQYERRAGSISSKQDERSMKSVITAWQSLAAQPLQPREKQILLTLIRDQENRIKTRRLVENFPSFSSFGLLPGILSDRNARRWLVLDAGSRLKRIFQSKR